MACYEELEDRGSQRRSLRYTDICSGPSSTDKLDINAVAAFVENLFPSEMSKRHIPGAVFVLVSGGQVAIARGFGFADLASGRPVDPNRTIFGVGSVSKLVTATAALQLVELGRLDLTRDINAYLRASGSSPIQARSPCNHLLTHTAGFDEQRSASVVVRQSSESRSPHTSHGRCRLDLRCRGKQSAIRITAWPSWP